jgi:proton-dependent oligopeptide transporter, POT family
MNRQPTEMYYLSIIEMCQRFGLWGIGNLLVIYTITHYQFSDASAAQLYGLFSGIAFILPLLGGYVADRTNYKAAVVIGSLALTIGCFLMAFGMLPLLYVALLFVAIGTSIFTPSIYTILGSIYHEREELREGGFSIYYAAVNVGVFLGTFILGALGHAKLWSLAFIVAGTVQLIGLVLFLKLMKSKAFAHLHQKHTRTMTAKQNQPLKKPEKDRIFVIAILSFISILFWIAYNQGWSSMSIFALRYTHLEVGNFSLPSGWLLSLESLFLIILAFPLSWFYSFLTKRGLNPTASTKTVFSLVAMGLCFSIMYIGSKQIPDGAQEASVSAFYPISAYALMAIAEMLLAPIGLSLVTQLSPRRYTALLVGMWYLCVGIAFYIGGTLGGLMTGMTSISSFFDIFVLMSWIPALGLAFFVKKLHRMSHSHLI